MRTIIEVPSRISVDGKRLKSNGLTIKFQGKLFVILIFQFSTLFLVTFGYKIYVLKKHKMQVLSEEKSVNLIIKAVVPKHWHV